MKRSFYRRSTDWKKPRCVTDRKSEKHGHGGCSGRCDFRESITADNTDDFGTVGGFFMRSIQTNPMIFMSDRLSVAFSFSRRAHLLTTCKAGGGLLPSGQARALFTNCLSAISPEGAGNAASGHSLCSRRYVLPNQ